MIKIEAGGKAAFPQVCHEVGRGMGALVSPLSCTGLLVKVMGSL